MQNFPRIFALLLKIPDTADAVHLSPSLTVERGVFFFYEADKVKMNKGKCTFTDLSGLHTD